MTEYVSCPVALSAGIKPTTKVMTRYTPNSGSGLQDT